MNKIIAVFLAITLLFSGCKPLENNVIFVETKAPVLRNDITFSYSADQIRYSDNNLKKSWANRNDVQVLYVKIINNSDKTIHGSQLSFLNNSQKLEIIDNELASKKLKSKKFPTFVYVVPIIIVGLVIYAGLMSLCENDSEDDCFDNDLPGSIQKTEEAKDPLYGANLIQKELYSFNIAKQVLRPGEQISGCIAFKAKTSIDTLDIQIRDVDFEVVDTLGR